MPKTPSDTYRQHFPPHLRKPKKAAAPEQPLAVVEILFRGKWTPVFEVAEYHAHRESEITTSEPVKQIRVRYLR